MTGRYLYAVSSGALVTLSLLFFMDRLIAMQPGAASDPSRTGTLTFIRIDEETDVQTTVDPPLRRDAFDPPLAPPRPDRDNGDKIVIAVGPGTPVLPHLVRDAIDSRASDGPLVAIIRVQPTYPAVMAQRGVEGWVLVEFDVLPDGNVSNVRTIESSHRGFEEAALRAAQRFRFKARVVDGVPRATNGLRNLFRFEME